MIFLFPLVLSFIGTVLLLNEDIGTLWKAVAVALTGGSLVLLFVPALRTHFLVPLAMQLIVCIWVALYWQIRLR